jgi:hypothetical protein
MKLSDQALGSLMMALQKCLLEQTDIVPILKSLDFELTNTEELKIKNPPSFKIDRNFFMEEKVKTTGSD